MPRGIYERTEWHKDVCGFQKGHPIYVKKHSEETKRKMSLAKKGKKRPGFSGENHWNWKNGKRKHSDGYIWILLPNHPFCDKQGYVLEHRLVVEKCIGRYLTCKEVVHHRGIKYLIGSIKNKQDNRPINLMLFPDGKSHKKYHVDKTAKGYRWEYA